MSTIRAATRLISEYEMSVWRLSGLRALAPPGLDSDDGADLVVAYLMGELDFAERFQERGQVHPENDRDSPCGGHTIRRPGCPRSDPKLRWYLPWRAFAHRRHRGRPSRPAPRATYKGRRYI